MNGNQREIDISIVVPMFNEDINVNYFFERLIPVLKRLNLLYEIICINDGSTDNTLEGLINYRERCPQVLIVNLSRNFGKEIAMTAGLQYSNGKAVIPIDSDLQDPPELIEKLIEKWREGFDVVYASRRQRRGESFWKRLTANLFYRFINVLSKTQIPRNTGDFRLMDRKVVDVLNRLPERTRFMKGLFAWVGFKQVSILFDREPRHGGTTKWSFWKLWNFALDGVTLFSTVFLRIWTYIGFGISSLAFIYASILLIRTLILGVEWPGYASTMLAILSLGGLNLISLGIHGEYLGRVYEEVKQRPIYIVSETYGFENSEGRLYHGEGKLSKKCSQ